MFYLDHILMLKGKSELQAKDTNTNINETSSETINTTSTAITQSYLIVQL